MRHIQYWLQQLTRNFLSLSSHPEKQVEQELHKWWIHRASRSSVTHDLEGEKEDHRLSHLIVAFLEKTECKVRQQCGFK